MSIILKYPCGCQYYSDRNTIEPFHLCIEHKIQVCKDALKDLIIKTTTDRSCSS